MNDTRYQNEPIRRYRGKRRPNPFRSAFLIALTVVILLGVVVFLMSITGTGFFSDRVGGSAEESADLNTDTTPVETEPEETDPETEDLGEVVYAYLDYDPSRIHEGNLVLIDKSNIYTFPKITIEMLSDYRTSSYALSGSTLALRSDVIGILNTMMDDFAKASGFTDSIITSAYRSFDIQRQLYEKNPTGAAQPGYSDYHTGTSIMLQGYTSASGTFSLSGRQEAMWLKENAHRYGFIFRYPSNKKALTGYELPWQMRYVEIPHASVMYEKDLCLEEYLDFLATFHPYAGEHLVIKGGDGMTYEIFYVAAGEEGITKVPVPENRAYTVNGDNMHGYVVAVALDVKGD